MRATAGRQSWLYVTLAIVALAVLTLIPDPSAPPDLLGYRSLCAQTPLSTLLLLLAAWLSHRLWVRGRRRRVSSSSRGLPGDEDPGAQVGSRLASPGHRQGKACG